MVTSPVAETSRTTLTCHKIKNNRNLNVLFGFVYPMNKNARLRKIINSWRYFAAISPAMELKSWKIFNSSACKSRLAALPPRKPSEAAIRRRFGSEGRERSPSGEARRGGEMRARNTPCIPMGGARRDLNASELCFNLYSPKALLLLKWDKSRFCRQFCKRTCTLGLKLLPGVINNRASNNFWTPTSLYDVAFSSLGGSYLINGIRHFSNNISRCKNHSSLYSNYPTFQICLPFKKKKLKK